VLPRENHDSIPDTMSKLQSTSCPTSVQHRRCGVFAALVSLFTASGLTACGGGSDGTSAATLPGAPTIGLAIAGDASASIAFTAPASDGGSVITGYRATCTVGTASSTATTAASPARMTGLTNGQSYACTVVALNAVGSSLVSTVVSVTPTTAPSGGGSSTAGVACGISGSEFNSGSSVNLTATYSWSCTSSSRVLATNGVPNHPVGTFPGPGNPNTIAAVPTTATYAISPAMAASPTAVITSGYGINGVKMEPATAGTCGDTGGTSCNLAGGGGAWSIEALGQSVFNFGVDSNNAHVQPNGSYHYHGMPEGLMTKLGGSTTTMTLVGWAPDGFPIYARSGYIVANNAASGLKVLASSYRLKTTPDTNRPTTSAYPMGAFSQDYEYVAGLGDLDECNGRSGVTPEFPEGIYHYVITSTYPYISRCVKGTPASIR
jgi:YHYH protein